MSYCCVMELLKSGEAQKISMLLYDAVGTPPYHTVYLLYVAHRTAVVMMCDAWVCAPLLADVPVAPESRRGPRGDDV